MRGEKRGREERGGKDRVEEGRNGKREGKLWEGEEWGRRGQGRLPS